MNTQIGQRRWAVSSREWVRLLEPQSVGGCWVVQDEQGLRPPYGTRRLERDPFFAIGGHKK